MLTRLALTTALTLAFTAAANADIDAQLDSMTLAGNAGDTLTFNVTLTNTSATDQIYLNGFSSTASSPGLSIDTSLFDINAPLFLDPLSESGDFAAFTVTIDSSLAPGAYIGSYVSVLGGADGGAGTAFDDLIDIPFDIDVNGNAPTAVPEPPTWSLLGFTGIALAVRRIRRD